MAIKQLSRREKRILIATALVVLVYLGYNFAYRAVRERKEALAAKVSAAENKLKKNLRLLSLEPAINAKYDRYLGRLRQTAPDQKEMAAILSEIETVAKPMDIKIVDMKPNRIKKEDFYNDLSASIQIKGNMSAITRFIYTLETPPHAFFISELRLEKTSVNQPEVNCQLVANRMLIQD